MDEPKINSSIKPMLHPERARLEGINKMGYDGLGVYESKDLSDPGAGCPLQR